MTHPTDSAPPAPSTHAPARGSAAGVESALVDGVDVDAVARAVRACAGVADLSTGRFGEIGTYLPGRRIGGVQVDDVRVTVHIRARWGHGVKDLLAQADAVTVALRNGRRLAVVVDDIDDALTDPGGTSANAEAAAAPPLAIEPSASRPSSPMTTTPPTALPLTFDTVAPLPESSTS